MNEEHMKRLHLELASWENRGITIWLDGYRCSSTQLSSRLCVNEENCYMRDYVFDKGVLKEVHFDKIEEQQ
ncbi:MAG: hypothetical protein PUB98_01970 [Clostridiales bacterium]|nr:hypothetical protein [Clostridiales bacterium]